MEANNLTPEIAELLGALEPSLRTALLTDVAARTSDEARLTSPDPTVRREAERELADEFALHASLPVDDTIDVQQVAVGDGWARGFRYRPRDSGTEPLPTQLFLHGGGFIGGSPEELGNHSVLSHRCADTRIQFYSMAYPLAPEYPYPVARDHALAIARELRDTAPDHGIDRSRFGIGGNSAGATIAASAALLAGDRGEHLFDHLYLEVPAGSLRPERVPPASPAGPSGDVALALLRAYLPDGTDDGFASPLEALRIRGLPPTLIAVAEFDPLRASGQLLAETWRDSGIDVSLIMGVGQLHASSSATAVSATARAFQAEISRQLATAYGTTANGTIISTTP